MMIKNKLEAKHGKRVLIYFQFSVVHIVGMRLFKIYRAVNQIRNG